MSPEHHTPQPAQSNEMIVVPDWDAETLPADVVESDVEAPVDHFAVGERAIVKRSDGTIEYNWNVAETGPDRIVVTKVDPSTGETIAKNMHRSELEALREKFNDKVALDVGEVSLEAAGIEQPVESAEESVEASPFDALPEDVKSEVLALRTARANHAASVADKDFSQAARDKERIYEIERSLSGAAKAFLKY